MILILHFYSFPEANAPLSQLIRFAFVQLLFYLL